MGNSNTILNFSVFSNSCVIVLRQSVFMKPPVNRVSLDAQSKHNDRTGLSLFLALLCVAAAGGVLWVHYVRPQLILMSSTDIELTVAFCGASSLYVLWWLVSSTSENAK